MGELKIAFCVNTPLRDLPGLVLTAYELCQNRAICYLIPQSGGFEELWAVAPDFVLLPAFRRSYINQARQYPAAGIQFGLLDTEQAIYNSIDDYVRTLWSDKATTEAASCVCMWGPMFADYLRSNRVFPEHQIHLTGCPRFDFYASPLKGVFQAGPRLGEAAGEKMVLINTNFTTANYYNATLNHLITSMARTYGYEEAEVKRWYEIEKQSIDETIRLANSLATDIPEVDVVIRPHPQEKCEPYEKGTNGRPNVHVRQEGSVTPWILRSRAVIHRSCTTAVEAVLAGIPALSPSWIPSSWSYPLPEAVSIQCKDYAELKSAVKSALDRELSPTGNSESTIRSKVHDWFYKTDGLAYKRVANAILSSISPKTRPDKRECLKRLYSLEGPLRLKGERLASAARFAAGLPPHWSFRRARANHRTELEPYFGLQEISELVKGISLARAEKKDLPVRVSRANEMGAYITSKFRGRAFVMESA